MVSCISSIEYSVTDSESSALLLEGQLISKFKPKFNILLKDDKSFPYIKLRTDHEYPQLLKFRGKNLINGKFFGPFASANHVNATLSEIQQIFKLRSCSDNYFSTRNRPCLQYQINRCSAPCVGKISKEDYGDLVIEVNSFLSGKNQLLQSSLVNKMERFSDKMEYENAAKIRDKLEAISYIQLKSQISHNLNDADLIAVATKNGEFSIQMFLYRMGNPCGNQAYFLQHTDLNSEIEDVLANFLIQIYQNKIPAKEILLSHSIEHKAIYTEALQKLHNINVKISTPKLGSRKKLMENAIYNAELALEKHLKISAKNNLALQDVQRLFDLKTIPQRIEVYDNSHIQGSFPIGAMIVAGSDGFDKKEYRLFNIKTINQKESSLVTVLKDANCHSAQHHDNWNEGDNSLQLLQKKFAPPPSLCNDTNDADDYAMLRQVLTRRLKRLKDEPARTPDLIIIDGGKGHMSTVQKLMDQLNIHLPFICMSKGVMRNSGQEQFHQFGKESFTLDKNLPVMKYLQILRDEVHNFAIKSHRKKRSANITASSLDSITDIGEVRKRALLNYFGSFSAIKDATIRELTQVDGISARLARIIHNELR